MANVIKHKRGSGSDPGASDLVVGEVAIRTDVGKLFTKMDNGSVAEIAGGGSDIAINTLSSSSATGGGSATFNGSAYRFTLSQPPSVSAQQLLVSINGVIQKPVAGTGQPSEGFSVDGTDIILGDAPATGADFFILTFKSLGVSEPADNSVTSAKIVDGAIVNADINASAAIDGSKISPDFGSQDITTTGQISGKDLILSDTTPVINLNDSTANPDYQINNTNGVFNIRDTTNSVDRLVVNTDGHVDIAGNLDVGAGIDVTGAIVGTGDMTIDTNTLHVDSSNNRVGIGTTSPSNTLTVSAGNPVLELQGTTTNGGNTFLHINANANHWCVGADNFTSQNLFVIKSGTPASSTHTFAINSSGNVGIGTTSPEGKLHLETGSSGASYSADNSDVLIIEHSDSVGIDLRSPAANSGNILFSDANARGQGRIGYGHNDDGMFFCTGGIGNTRLKIDSSGDVGIGSSTINLQSANRTVLNLNGTTQAALCFNRSDTITGFLYAASDEFRIQAEAGAGNLIRIRNSNGTIAQFNDQGLELLDGDLKVAAGHGIDFSATANSGGSMSSELLDDYEEGTWTPVFNTGSASTAMFDSCVYNDTGGFYTKIGNSVFFSFRIQTSSITNY